MSKEITAQIKLQITGGAANPAPPVGPALGQHGLNIQDFCTQFNNASADRRGEVVPVIINVYSDRSFDFEMKVAPASALIKQVLKLKSGSGKPNTEKVSELTQEQLREIAEKKMPDLNANDIEAAMKIIAGTARQMGVTIKE